MKTWRSLVEADPRLEDLERVAEQAGRNLFREWPSHRLWKAQLRRLVGADNEAFDVAMVHLLGTYRAAGARLGGRGAKSLGPDGRRPQGQFRVCARSPG